MTSADDHGPEDASAGARTPDPGPGPVVVVGESVVDRVRLADGSLRETPGGSPANVAIGLARLGHPTTFLTQLGADPAGELIRTHLGAAGVSVRESPTPTGRTSTAVATLAADGSATYDFDLDFALPASVAAGDLGSAAALHLGSVSAVLGPHWDRLRALAQAVHGRALVSYDVNLRPALTGAGADVRRRVESLVAVSDLVKASDEDLAALWPRLDPEAAAAHLMGLGATAVVVTLGSRGALALTGETSVHRAAHPVAVVDTIGAGDSFMVGLLDSVIRTGVDDLAGEAWTSALERAAANAAFTVAHAGAAMPSRSDLRLP